jgi:hypothetical protein
MRVNRMWPPSREQRQQVEQRATANESEDPEIAVGAALDRIR